MTAAGPATTWTVAASEALARDLRVRHGLARRAAGAAAWEVPTILGFRRWISRLWEWSWPEAQLLHPVQELALWQQVIEDDSTGAELIAPRAAAQGAQRAAELMAQYRVDPADPAFASGEEARAFARWHTAFRRRLRDMGWITSADLPDDVIRLLRDGRVPLPERIHWTGFAAHTPQQDELLAAIAAAGTRIERSRPATPGSIATARPADAAREIRWAAERVRLWLEPYARDPGAAPRIALVAPRPEEIRIALDAALHEALLGSGPMPSGTARPAWRHARGESLAAQEVVALALAILRLRDARNPFADVSRILLSPALAPRDERSRRAAVERRLRTDDGVTVSLAHLQRRGGDAGAAALAAGIERLRAQLAAEPSRALPSEWLAHLDARLAAFGWPWDEGGLASRDHQVLERWRGVRADFAAMDRQLGRVSGNVALRWFAELMRAVEFQPQVAHAQPVSVLGLDEVPGMRFDKAIVIGLDAMSLPVASDPNPFLPFTLQRRLGMPGTDPASDLERGRALLGHLGALGDEVLLSCPLRTDEGALRVASPLVAEWPSAEATPGAATDLATRTVAMGVQSRLPEDPERVAAVGAEEARGMRGGARRIAEYLESPFLAFARGRLGLEALDVPEAGIDPMTQGDLVHRALNQVWNALRDSRRLRVLDDGGVTEVARAAAVAAVDADRRRLEARFGARIIALETERIAGLVAEWLALERARVDEFEVIAREAPLQGAIDRLPLKLRIDRIDRVQTPEGPRFLIIDYKTGGGLRPGVWRPETMSEPQLPLYATRPELDGLGVPRVDGIAFAQVRASECAFVLAANWTGNLLAREAQDPESAEAWAGQLAEWERALEAAARGFLDGDAVADAERFDPRGYHADLEPLLRRWER